MQKTRRLTAYRRETRRLARAAGKLRFKALNTSDPELRAYRIGQAAKAAEMAMCAQALTQIEIDTLARS